MTRKDYELLAEVVRDLKLRHYDRSRTQEHRDSAAQIVGDMERAIARALIATNPRFNVERFLEACSLSH